MHARELDIPTHRDLGDGGAVPRGAMEDIRLEIETHYLGSLRMARAFVPQLAGAPGGGAILNVLSVLSWFTSARFGTYAAAKAAAWSPTNALRVELAEQGTQVTALHVGFMDTDIVRHIDAPKIDPAVVARLAPDAPRRAGARRRPGHGGRP